MNTRNATTSSIVDDGSSSSSSRRAIAPFKKLTTVSNSKKSAKVIVIRGLADAPTLPADFEDTAWNRLAATVAAIYESRAVGDSVEQLYNAVETLCTNGRSARLYERLRDAMAAHCGDVLYKRLTHGISADVTATLRAVDATWTAFCDHSTMLRNVFLYLDRTYVFVAAAAAVATTNATAGTTTTTTTSSASATNTATSTSLRSKTLTGSQNPSDEDGANSMAIDRSSTPGISPSSTTTTTSTASARRSLWEVAMNDFRELVLQRNDGALLVVVRDALLELVARDRDGAEVDRPLARRMMRMLATLDLYSTHFEPALLATSVRHFETEAAVSKTVRIVSFFLKNQHSEHLSNCRSVITWQ